MGVFGRLTRQKEKPEDNKVKMDNVRAAQTSLLPLVAGCSKGYKSFWCWQMGWWEGRWFVTPMLKHFFWLIIWCCEKKGGAGNVRWLTAEPHLWSGQAVIRDRNSSWRLHCPTTAVQTRNDITRARWPLHAEFFTVYFCTVGEIRIISCPTWNIIFATMLKFVFNRVKWWVRAHHLVLPCCYGNQERERRIAF